MPKKNKTHRDIIRKHNLHPVLYDVIKEQPFGLIVKHRLTGNFKLLEK